MELHPAATTSSAQHREPYRIFFPLGIALAWAGVLHWFLLAVGVMGEYRAVFHSMAQIEGFLACFATGFLFTMIPRRTGTPGPTRLQMLVGLACPIATTVCAWFERWALAQVFWIALLVLLVSFAGRRLAKVRGPRPVPDTFVWIPAAFLAGIAGAVLAGVGAARGDELMWLHDVGRGIVLQGVFTCLIVGVGGMLIPLLVRAEPPVEGGGIAVKAAHLSAAAVFLASFWAEQLVSIRVGFALRAAVVAAVIVPVGRLWRPPSVPGLHRKLVWVAAWMLPLGYASVAAFPEYRRIGLHVVFIGSFALLTLAIAMHVVAAHGGGLRLLDATPPPVRVMAAFLGVALTARLLVDLWPAHSALWLAIAAAAFLCATIAWLRVAWPRLRRTGFSTSTAGAPCRTAAGTSRTPPLRASRAG